MNKEKIIKIIIIVIILTLSITCLTNYYINKYKEHKKIDNTEELSTENINSNNEEINDKEEEKYNDDNTVPISLYIESGDNLIKINEFTCNWDAENVFNVFYAIPSNEEIIPNNNFDTMWKEKISAYPNSEKCRIGYQISFNYEDGKTYTYNVKNPDDAYYTFPKVMTFLYDDVNLVPGKPYYHITQDVMYDYTIASSIKLVGDIDTDKITGPITLTAFCFDSEDDFDENGNYRGNSKYSITIYKQ